MVRQAHHDSPRFTRTCIKRKFFLCFWFVRRAPLCQIVRDIIFNMNQYAFLLGKNASLSVAELGVFFGEGIDVANNNEVAFVDKELPTAPQDFLNRLGGTTEILEIFKKEILPSIPPAPEQRRAIVMWVTRSEWPEPVQAAGTFLSRPKE